MELLQIYEFWGDLPRKSRILKILSVLRKIPAENGVDNGHICLDIMELTTTTFVWDFEERGEEGDQVIGIEFPEKRYLYPSAGCYLGLKFCTTSWINYEQQGH